MRKLTLALCLVLLLVVCGALASTMNEQIARRVFDEGLSQGHFDLAKTLYTPNAVVHFEQEGRDAKLENAREEAREWRAMAPNLKMKIEGLSASGDFVTIRWAGMGEHTNAGRGIKASGKHFEVHGTSKFRFENGKIAETWVNWDENDLRKQLGAPEKQGTVRR